MKQKSARGKAPAEQVFEGHCRAALVISMSFNKRSLGATFSGHRSG
jgi:hypothetical protein